MNSRTGAMSKGLISANSVKTARTHVLYVDADASRSKVVKECLELQGGFDVDVASSVEVAGKKIRAGDYDAIVSDFMSPGREVLEFVRGMRSGGDLTPFVLFAVIEDMEVMTEALRSGIDAFIGKHGDPKVVYNDLSRAIRESTEKHMHRRNKHKQQCDGSE